jgi:hypothetical protein
MITIRHALPSPLPVPTQSPRFEKPFSFGTTYTFLDMIDPTAPGANGFQNLDTTFKYRVYKNPEHEFVFSVGLSIE